MNGWPSKQALDGFFDPARQFPGPGALRTQFLLTGIFRISLVFPRGELQFFAIR